MGNQTAATILGKIIAKLRLSQSFLWRLEARIKGVEFEGQVQFQGRPIISLVKASRIVMGHGVSVASARRANPLGLFQPCVLRAMAPGAQLILGPGVGLSGTVVCAGTTIEIGEKTIFGAGAMVLDNDFHSPSAAWGWSTDNVTNARPIKIGRGAFIGARAIILKGVTIGDRALIGAGAVVTKDVPAQGVAVGNPARVLPARISPSSSN
jgi:acetyltransferase-like isoleucine patch superfamily enzyme